MSVVALDLPADVDVSAVLQQFPCLVLIPPQQVLHVHLVRLVPGECRVQLRQRPVIKVTVKLILVDKVLALVSTSKVQDCVADGLA